jgi:hypothetical protein
MAPSISFSKLSQQFGQLNSAVPIVWLSSESLYITFPKSPEVMSDVRLLLIMDGDVL